MSRWQQDNHRGGFTLVELVLVVLIVMVISAIALPRFAQATARQQLSAAADRVSADLNKARTRARATSQTVTVTFDTATHSYQFSGGGSDATAIQLDQSPYNVDIRKVTFNGSSLVSFNGYGAPSSSGAVVLESNSGTVTVLLDSNGEASR